MEWGSVAEALILAACTWYIRRGGKRDREDVKRTTAELTQSQSHEIIHRIETLEGDFRGLRVDVELVKQMAIRDSNPRPTAVNERKKND
jgi:hypothetical protein